MNTGLWADLNAEDLETTLLDIINAGGDTEARDRAAAQPLAAGVAG